MPKPKLLLISESLRRDIQEPLKYFDRFEVKHFFLKAPYGDYTKEDIAKDESLQEVQIEQLVEEIGKFKPDVLQGVEPFGSRLAFKLATKVFEYAKDNRQTKLIIPVLENRPIKERFSLPQRIALRAFVPRYFRRADLFFALNTGAVTNIQSYSRSANIVEGVIWGVWGVDTEFFKPVALKKDNTIIYLGRFVREKGIEYLLDGFKSAQSKLPDIKLNFYGKGELEQIIRDFAKINGLEDNISVKGYVDFKILPRIISQASLTVYPSITVKKWEEQIGTVNLQSLACSTPVISTKSGAIPEYLKDGEGAILVEEKSAEAIARAIVSYFSDKKLQDQLIDKARKFVLQYDVRETVIKSQKILFDLLDEKD